VLELWQSASEAQEVLQLVPFAHTTPPGHGPGAPTAHVPVPLHTVSVITPPLQTPVPQDVPAGVISQEAPEAHLPSLPHGGLAVHCPGGAGVPAFMAAHTPFAAPVSAFEHALHVARHAELQQKPLTQKPLTHWLAAVHALP
jgi:hypothetical protein